jgi:predicted Zn-ribbon and HTH transcriptional regulator
MSLNKPQIKESIRGCSLQCFIQNSSIRKNLTHSELLTALHHKPKQQNRNGSRLDYECAGCMIVGFANNSLSVVTSMQNDYLEGLLETHILFFPLNMKV